MAESIDTTKINQNFAALSKSVQELIAVQSAYARDVIDFTQNLEDNDEELEKFKRGIASNTKLTEVQKRLANDYIRAKEKENGILKAVNQTQNSLLKMQQTGSQQTAAYAKQQQNLIFLQQQHAQAQGKTAIFQNQFSGSLKGLLGNFGKFGSLLSKVYIPGFSHLLTVVALVTDRLDKAKAQMVNNVGFIEDLGKTGSAYDAMLQQRMMALGRGLKPEELAKMSSQFRNVIMATGGLEKSLQLADTVRNDFYGMTGDMNKAVQLSMEAMQNFAVSGVYPSQRSLRAYTDDVNQLSRATGLAADQIMQLYKEVDEDESSRILLKSARDEEREAILENNRALLLMARAAGMTAEQAKEAAKMLNKMVAAKPLDRIKQAAKVRALGAAMGVSSGAEAAQALIAGPRRTSEQSQQLLKFNQQLTGVLDQARGRSTESELFSSILTEKLGLEEYFGSNSPFSATLGDVIKKGDENAKKQINISQSQLAEAMRTSDYLYNMLQNTDDILEFFLNKFASMLGTVLKDWATVIVSGFAGPFQAMLGMFAKLIGKIPGLGSVKEWGDEMWNKGGESISTFLHGTPEMQAAGTKERAKLPTLISPTEARKKEAEQLGVGEEVVTTAKQTAEVQTQQKTSIDTQLQVMRDNSVTFNKMLALLLEANELSKQQLVAMALTSEKERKAIDIGERLGDIRSATTRYRNVFSTQ